MSLNFMSTFNAEIKKPYEEVKKEKSLPWLKFEEITAKIKYIAAIVFSLALGAVLVISSTIGMHLFKENACFFIMQTVVPFFIEFSLPLAIVAGIVSTVGVGVLFGLASHIAMPCVIVCLGDHASRVIGHFYKYASKASRKYKRAEKEVKQAFNEAKTTWQGTQNDRDNLYRMHLKSQNPEETDFHWNKLPDEVKDEIAGYVLGCDNLKPSPY